MINETYAKVPDDFRPLVERYIELQDLEKGPWARYYKELALVSLLFLGIIILASLFGQIMFILGFGLFGFLGVEKRREYDLEPFTLEREKIEKQFEDHGLWLALDPAGKLFLYPNGFRP